MSGRLTRFGASLSPLSRRLRRLVCAVVGHVDAPSLVRDGSVRAWGCLRCGRIEDAS